MLTQKISFHQCTSHPQLLATIKSPLPVHQGAVLSWTALLHPHLQPELLATVASVLSHCRERPTDHCGHCGSVCVLSVLGRGLQLDL